MPGCCWWKLAVIDSRHNFIADPLNELDTDNNDDDGDDHDLRIKALIPIVIGQSTKTATADEPGHCRIPYEYHNGVGGCSNEPWKCLRKENFRHNLTIGESHDFSGVDGAGWHFTQGGLDQARKERCRGNGQRDGRGDRAD